VNIAIEGMGWTEARYGLLTELALALNYAVAGAEKAKYITFAFEFSLYGVHCHIITEVFNQIPLRLRLSHVLY